MNLIWNHKEKQIDFYKVSLIKNVSTSKCLCIARRVYTDNHMNVIAAALKNVYDRRDSIKHGVKIVWETELMRHFTVKLERINE